MSFKSIKVVKVIETFSTVELNRLEKFIASPYFNVNEPMTRLFSIVHEAVKNETLESLDKESVFSELYPRKKYSDSRFRKLCSDLLKLIEEFLAIEQFKDNPLHEAGYLMQSIANRKIDPMYNSVLKSARRLSSRQYEMAASYYYHQYEIEKNYFYMLESEMKRETRLNLEQIAKNLDHFYMAEKLRYYATALSQKYFATQEYKLLFMDEILSHLEMQDYSDIPQISVNLAVLKVYMYPDNEEYYYQLKSEIFKNIDRFPTLEARDIFFAALNFCVRKGNKGVEGFIKESFLLYQFALDKNYLYYHGELTPWTFKNIVFVGLRLKEFDWVENFIHRYSRFLSDEHRNNAVTFNLARLYLYKKDLGKVLELLREVEFDDMSYSLSSKAMLLATYYDLDEIDALHSFLNSFRVFLNRKKNQLPDQRRKNYLNLIKYVKKMSSLNPYDKQAIVSLKKELENTKDVADMQWLMEKLAELEN
nr:hypothetical protein [Saprospiraceae bacterium]